MNTNQLKKFAQEARRKLIDQVSAKLNYVLTSDSAELREKGAAVQKLKEALKEISKEQLVDKVAYTWFNRFVALRFMDVNDYQPIGVQVLSTLDGFTTPEILDDAKRGNIHDELQVNRRKIGDLLDGRIPSSNAQNEVYKLLLTGVCNHLHKTFPFLFERIDDYTELLLPDDLTSEFSIVQDIREGMSKEDCKEVEIIGWLYQFYISEKKDEVFASKDKVKKEDIPAATQLFTPRWIVEYMVQNTVGKLWLLNNPSSKLKDQMPYYIESEEKNEDYLKVSSVEEITLLDQACGSGHILVYGFELFSKIYEEQGYNQSEIPELIINKNLYGFEIDERAAQLSGFALLMKAREYHRRVFRKELKPNILCYKDLRLSEVEIKDTFNQLKIELTDELYYDIVNIQQATNLGSLISPHTDNQLITQVSHKIKANKDSSDVFLRYRLEELDTAFNHLSLLAKKYHCIVDNPPYMGNGNMNKTLSKFVGLNYPKSKTDLMTCFMEAGLKSLKEYGYMSMINFSSWVFLISFEKLRVKLIEESFIDSFLHIGRGMFGSDFGTVSFTIQKAKPNDRLGTYRKLFENQVDVRSQEKIKALFLDTDYNAYRVKQEMFKTIPSNVFAYWLKLDYFEIFSNAIPLKNIADAKQGLATSNNNRFRRNWSEIDFSKSSIKTGTKWHPYNSGGEYRKWYGNQNYFVNWENDGYEIKNFPKSVTRNTQYYFKPSISWSKIAYSLSFRYFPEGFIFDVAGCSVFIEDEHLLLYTQGLLNSKLSKPLLQDFSATVNFEVGQINQFPIYVIEDIKSEIVQLVKSCIDISKEDWDKSEMSWDFKSHPLLKFNSKEVEEALDLFYQSWEIKASKLKSYEEKINRLFINGYKLDNTVTEVIELEELTIAKDFFKIYGDRMELNTQEIIKDLVSYAVGVMFGRYSLDKEGLILANQGDSLQDYLLKLEKEEAELSFIPDDDNIIPILDDEWFEDDIVGRFYKFLRTSFGEQNFEKNLSFIEESIGKDIRKYFVNDFYRDHIQRYKKRPIYWMFSSPKGTFNVLIYMHRYNSDTLNQVLNGYLNEYREKLKTRMETLDHLMISGSPSEQNKAAKEKDKIQLVLLELQEYDREVLYPLATERIPIDLDDGVLVNYNKFGNAIAPVAGLNDKKTKEKVKKFDWIDTTTIR